MLIRLSHLSRLSLVCLATLFVVPTYAATVQSDTKATVKKKPSKRKAAPPKAVEETPDTKDARSTDFDCDAGNKVTIYIHETDESRVALRWKNKLLQMKRIDTATGADRFENTKAGLVWIGIPAKGILLDAKKGQQLANECKSAAQKAIPVEVPATATPPATPAPSTTPPVAPTETVKG